MRAVKTKLLKSCKDTYSTIKDADKIVEFSTRKFEMIGKSQHEISETFVNLSESLQEKVFSLKGYIDGHPWEKEIEEIRNSVQDKIHKIEMNDFRIEVSDQISNINAKVEQSNVTIVDYSHIIERFDEILLEKASKDDIESVRKELPKFVIKQTYQENNHTNSKLYKVVQAQILNINSSISAFEISSQTLVHKFEMLKKDNHDVSNVSRILGQIREDLARKADKSDICEIYDRLGRQEDITKLYENEDLNKRQLELTAVLTYALCRTMLKIGETPDVIRKKRDELYRNLGTLVNWIGGCKAVREMELKSDKSEIKTDRSHIKIDFSSLRDESYSTLNSPSKNRIKHKRNSHSLMFKDAKVSIDLPPLKSSITFNQF